MGEGIPAERAAGALWEKKWPLAMAAAICGLITYVTCLNLPKSYTSEAVIFFPKVANEGQLGNLLSTVGLGQLALGRQATLNGEQCKLILDSRELRVRVAKRLGLKTKWRIDKTADVVAKLKRVAKAKILPAGQLQLECREASPEEAQRMGCVFLQELDSFVRKVLSEGAAKRREMQVKASLAEVRRELGEAEAAARRFEESEGVVSPGDQFRALFDSYASAKREEFGAVADLDAYWAEKKAIVARLQALGSGAWEDIPADSAFLSLQREKLAELKQQYEIARLEMKDESPQVRALKASLDEAEKFFREQLKSAMGAIDKGTAPELAEAEVGIVMSNAKVSAMRRVMENLDAQVRRWPEKLARYAVLQREVAVKDAVYRFLKTQEAQVLVEEASEELGYIVLDSPSLPENYSAPRPKFSAVIAAALALFLGAVFVLAAEGRRGESA
jgi:uncharacterized protein involved in exopolysaccharide biosynthesis